MKNLYLTIVTILFSVFITYAQQTVSFGIKAGVNFSKATGNFKVLEADETEKFNTLTSFHAGVLTEIMLSEKLALQPEVLYSKLGTNRETTSQSAFSTSKDTEEFKLDYINVPVMIKFFPVKGLSVEAGAYINFLVSAKLDYKLETTNVITTVNEGSGDIKDFIKPVDYGANFGIGYKLDNGINFSARYVLGLTNFNETTEADDSEVKHSVIQVSLGFFF